MNAPQSLVWLMCLGNRGFGCYRISGKLGTSTA
jgi:hypothetical protein